MLNVYLNDDETLPTMNSSPRGREPNRVIYSKIAQYHMIQLEWKTINGCIRCERRGREADTVEPGVCYTTPFDRVTRFFKMACVKHRYKGQLVPSLIRDILFDTYSQE